MANEVRISKNKVMDAVGDLMETPKRPARQQFTTFVSQSVWEAFESVRAVTGTKSELTRAEVRKGKTSHYNVGQSQLIQNVIDTFLAGPNPEKTMTEMLLRYSMPVGDMKASVQPRISLESFERMKEIQATVAEKMGERVARGKVDPAWLPFGRLIEVLLSDWLTKSGVQIKRTA
jgi:hypothetical protein